MSKKRLLSSFAAIGGALLITTRFAVLYFPISAPAQEVVRGEANLRHRAPIAYPADAIEKGIQGTVVVEATLNDRGVVTEARVISGPELLRKAAIQSVLDWHYAAQTQSPVEVAIDFKLPEKRPGPGGAPMMAPSHESGRLNRIKVMGISPALRDAVMNGLTVRVGDLVEPNSLARIRQAVNEIDEHLDARFFKAPAENGQTEYALQIFSTSPMDVPASGVAPDRIRVGGNVQATQVISGPKPVYPPEAKQARIQGVVKLSVIIGKDGTVQDIKAMSGHPILVPASLEAVRQWIYKPTLLNGQPVEVETVVDVNFTLSQ